MDLYAGPGGLSLGLMEACRAVGRGFESVAAFELNSAAAQIFETNIGGRVLIEDVRTGFTGRNGSRLSGIEQQMRRAFGNVDFLLAGPPCQGWSSLNNVTRGNDPKNLLYKRVARAAEVLRPATVLIENVVAARRDALGAPQRTAEQLARLGYSVQEFVVSMLDLGVAQARRRHVVLATTSAAVDVSTFLAALRCRPRDLRWAIGDLTTGAEADDFNHPSTPSARNVRRMSYLRQHGLFNLPNRLRPRCHWGVHSYVSMYGRLHWNLPAQTITSGFGSMGQGRFVHPDGRRTLTPHEAARIQFFPDWFDFGTGTRSAWATSIGNAVPMKLSYAIGLALLR